MENLPHDLLALSLLVFVLGLRHGFDGLCNPFSVNSRGGGHDDRVTG